MNKTQIKRKEGKNCNIYFWNKKKRSSAMLKNNNATVIESKTPIDSDLAEI